VLEPIQYGWRIYVGEKNRSENLAQSALFDYHDTNIEGWHFRNEDNTDSGHVHGDAYSQDDRELYFPRVGETISVPQTINQTNMEDIWQMGDRIAAFGQGEFKITQMKLSPPRLHETATIEEMNFQCKLTWRRKSS